MSNPFSSMLPPVAARVPFVRRGWTANRIAVVCLICLLPPALAGLYGHGGAILPVITVSVVAVVLWQLIFNYVRRRCMGLDGLVSALVFALIVGPSVPLWQAAMAVSFGVIAAEQVFGGRGFNFLNPVVVALAFLVFSFPTLSFVAAAPWMSVSAVPAAIILILTRMMSWRQFTGILASLFFISLVAGDGSPAVALLQGYGLFILVFLACDPVSSAATNTGRWANGVLIGGLIWFFAPVGGLAAGPVPFVQATLLASIFAPLIDTVVVMLNVRRRRASRG